MGGMEVAAACTAGTDLGERLMNALYQCDYNTAYTKRSAGDEDWHQVLDRRGLNRQETVTLLMRSSRTSTTTPPTDSVSGSKLAGTISPTLAGSTSSSTRPTWTVSPPPCPSPSSGTGRWASAGAT